LDKEAEEKIADNKRLLDTVSQKIASFNQSVFAINACLVSMQLYDYLLPPMEETTIEIVDTVPCENNGIAQTI